MIYHRIMISKYIPNKNILLTSIGHLVLVSTLSPFIASIMSINIIDEVLLNMNNTYQYKTLQIPMEQWSWWNYIGGTAAIIH